MHSCPDCGQACYCHGDIDDCEVETEEYSSEHCVCDCAEEGWREADEDDEWCVCPDCEEDANGGGLYCEYCSQQGCTSAASRCVDDDAYHTPECRCPGCADRRAGNAPQPEDA